MFPFVHNYPAYCSPHFSLLPLLAFPPFLQQIVLCITSWNGKIGCCYYDPNERKLFLMEDQVDSAKFDSALNSKFPVDKLTLAFNDTEKLTDVTLQSLTRSTPI
jgi:hypothetical protein